MMEKDVWRTAAEHAANTLRISGIREWNYVTIIYSELSLKSYHTSFVSYQK
jgi:hypothetical protein